MNSRLSRSERRTLQRDDAPFLKQPLPLSTDPRAMAAHVRHVVHLLRAPGVKSPSSSVMAHVGALHDRTVPKQAQAMVVCRKGCAHCCSQMVIATAPEVFYVAAQVRQRPEMASAVSEVAEQTAVLSLEDRLARDIFCPMLQDAVCAIYAVRPLGCRGFVSTNLEACLAAFTREAPPDIPMPNDSISVLYACRILLMSALRLAGLRDSVYELNSAVAVALRENNTEARWLAGEDVFKSLHAAPPPPLQFEAIIRQMVAHVAPTV